MSERTELLLEQVDRTASIIEIGPGASPIAPRAEGWNTTIVDVMTTAGLMEKFGALVPLFPTIDTNNIEDVDFVWPGGPLGAIVPSALHGTFDALIASHVIEHIPNMIEFLNSAATLLTPTGIIILAVPDKRLCFDYFRPLTTTGDLLSAQRRKLNRHTGKSLFDSLAYAANADGALIWGRQIGSIGLNHSLETAYSVAQAYDEDSSDYVDAHGSTFTPASFQLLILELARLKICDWQVERLQEYGIEIHVWLRRGGTDAAAALSEADVSARRTELLKQMLLETREQLEFLNDHSSTGVAGQVPAREDATQYDALRHERDALQEELEQVKRQRDALAESIANVVFGDDRRCPRP